MKTIILLLLITTNVSAQVVVLITQRDSLKFESRVRGFTRSELKLFNSTVQMKELLSVGFTEYRETGGSLYDALLKNKVRVYYDYKAGSIGPLVQPGDSTSVSPILNLSGPITIEEVVLHLEDFRRQRQTGTIISLLGLTTSIIGIATIDTNANNPSLLIPYIGLGVMTVGAIITVTADGHLKIR
mgnify:CR=1 FL=1